MRRGLIFPVAAMCAVSMLAVSCADEKGAPNSPGGEQVASPGGGAEKAQAVVREMAHYLAELDAFSCQVVSSIAIQASGMNQEMETKMSLRLQRPNRIALVVEQGLMGVTLISDGEKLYQFMPTLNRYTVQDAPEDLANLDEAGGGLGTAMMGLSGGMFPTDGDEFYETLMSGTTKSEYLGTEEVGDVTCHHCRFDREEMSWEIWIETGDRPLPQRIVPDLSRQFADAGESFKDAKIEYTVNFSNWDVTPNFGKDAFAFTPPSEAEKVDSLFEGLGGGGSQGPHPMVGKEAPSFETVNVEGEPVDLAKHLGKDIILLDFWATWCGPCVKAMPEVDAVAEKFAAQGLVFYAVNSGEDAETVKEFLKTSEIDVPVAMDPDGSIGDKYGVEGIPQTVLIGKDGNVQVVHVGFSSALGKELTQNVEDLMAGKDLASEALAEAEKSEDAPAAESDDEAQSQVESVEASQAEATSEPEATPTR